MRMIPDGLQAPSRFGPAMLQIVSTGESAMAFFRSRPPAKNATARLSGDQNGEPAPLVSASGVARSASTRLIHRLGRPSLTPTKTIWVPSGDAAKYVVVSLKLAIV